MKLRAYLDIETTGLGRYECDLTVTRRRKSKVVESSVVEKENDVDDTVHRKQ